MLNTYTSKITEFVKRWWVWLSAGLLFVVALDAKRRAENRVEKLRRKSVDIADEEIGSGWDDVAVANIEVKAAQNKVKKVIENANKQLDRLAKVDRSGSDIISDWNAANRLRDSSNAT